MRSSVWACVVGVRERVCAFRLSVCVRVGFILAIVRVRLCDKFDVQMRMCGLYPVYTCTFNPERNRFRAHASV